MTESVVIFGDTGIRTVATRQALHPVFSCGGLSACLVEPLAPFLGHAPGISLDFICRPAPRVTLCQKNALFKRSARFCL
jgi:hypothetical protein